MYPVVASTGIRRSSGYFLLYLEGCFFSLCLPTSVGGDGQKYRLAPDLAGRILAGCSAWPTGRGVAALGIVGLVASHLVSAPSGSRPWWPSR